MMDLSSLLSSQRVATHQRSSAAGKQQTQEKNNDVGAHEASLDASGNQIKWLSTRTLRRGAFIGRRRETTKHRMRSNVLLRTVHDGGVSPLVFR